MKLDDIADKMIETIEKHCERKTTDGPHNSMRGELLADLARYRVVIDSLWTQMHAAKQEHKRLLQGPQPDGLYTRAGHLQAIEKARQRVVEAEQALGIR